MPSSGALSFPASVRSLLVMRVHERRRLVLATALTVVALPAIWLMDRDDPSAATSPAVAAIGVPEPGAGSVSPETSLVPQVPVFLDNTVLLPQPAVIDIAVPDSVPDTERTARLTYKDYSDYGDAMCTLGGAPSGAHIHVTNVDNGQEVWCTNTLGMSIPVGSDMAIDINLFVRIADLVDAPVPVRVSW
jgi:hypothetical protein